ncbi:MAG: hypothetical protein K2Q26_07735 [Bdellovibrionales bacterium]|nr:hypothetical protein [Bdellovibrionales bacterium]
MSTQNQNIEDVFNDWKANPERKVFVIDEIRPDKVGGQYIIYSMACYFAKDILIAYDTYQSLLKKIPAQTANAALKGKDLFGNKPKRSHDLIRQYASAMVLGCRRLFSMATTSAAVLEFHIENPGRIKAKQADGTLLTLESPELRPVQLFLKRVAVEMQLGDEQIDVIVDNSDQIGFKDLDKDTVQSLGPDQLNTVFGGGPSKLICESYFRLLFASEDMPKFKHCLMVPDSICYLGEKAGYFSDLKNGLANDPFWLQELDAQDLYLEFDLATINQKVDASKKETRTVIAGFLNTLKKFGLVSEFETRKIVRNVLTKHFSQGSLLGPKYKKDDFVSVTMKKGARYALCGIIDGCINPDDRNGFYKYKVRLLDPQTYKISMNSHDKPIRETRLTKSLAAEILYSAAD